VSQLFTCESAGRLEDAELPIVDVDVDVNVDVFNAVL
jgi:hypothetical protein